MTKTPKKISKTKFRKGMISILFLVAVLIVGAVAGTVIGTVIDMPKWDAQALYGAETTSLYDKNGDAFYALHAGENRVQVSLSVMPEHLKQAFIATEDQQFYKHHGINFVAIARAVLVNISSGSKSQGASTITQQLARTAFLTTEKTWERKIKEIVVSIQLESKYSKDEIFEFYLNRINFGSGAWGVQVASNTYFGKDVEELSLAESAVLAGLVQRPNAYSPFKNPDLTKKRQAVVLDRMLDCGFITQEEADEATKKPLEYAQRVETEERYGFFVDYVIDEADRILERENLFENPQDAIYNGGLEIFTTMDPAIQAAAEKIYANPNNFPKQTSKSGQVVQSSMVLLDHKSGGIQALVGGREYTQKRGFNRAVDMLRQPGSSFKPIVVYGPALEAGYNPSYILDDAPVTYTINGEEWSPKNYDDKYRGRISMRTAVRLSINIYAIKMADKVGIANGVAFAEDLGITSLVKAGHLNDMSLSTALGGITKGVSPLEMASAYGAFANGGILAQHHVITKIVDSQGNTIYEFHPKSERVMEERTAWMMTSMLQDVVKSGTGTAAQISGVACAGKTGTTQDDRDAWYVGYTPTHTAAVWMGYDKRETMTKTTGGSYPARIWKAVMTKAAVGGSFAEPTGLEKTAICSVSGKLASAACPAEAITEDYMEADEVPTEYCDIHYLVSICPDSGKRATDSCPAPVDKGFVKDAPADSPEAAPTQYCDVHSSKAEASAMICTDPRHDGRQYLANIPADDEIGGCPSEYVREKTIRNLDDLAYCPLPDHQTTR